MLKRTNITQKLPEQGVRYSEGEELPPLDFYQTRQSIVRVSKRIIRRMGHLMPKGAWLETFNWPGTKLTAKCRHCSRLFVIAGRPDVGTGKWKPAAIHRLDDEPGFKAEYELNPWMMSELISNDHENATTIAFKPPKADFYNDRIVEVGPKDWDKDVEDTDSPEIRESKIIEKKLSIIYKRFCCAKVQTWL